VLSEERGRAHWLMRRGMVLPAGVWGVAWLLGFLAMWSGEGRGGNPWFRLAEPAAEGIFGSAIVAAAVVSVLVGIVSRRGVQGPSQLRDSLQGWAWSISMVAVGIASLMLTSQAPGQRWLLVPTLFTLTAGALTMVSGAMLASVLDFALGGVLVLLAVCGVWLGLPGMFLLYGLAGGVALLAFAVVVRLRPVREVRQ